MQQQKESTFVASGGRSDGVSSSNCRCSTAYGSGRNYGHHRWSVSRAAFASDVGSGDIPTAAGLFGSRSWGRRRKYEGRVVSVRRKRSKGFTNGKPVGAMRMSRDLYEARFLLECSGVCRMG